MTIVGNAAIISSLMAPWPITWQEKIHKKWLRPIRVRDDSTISVAEHRFNLQSQQYTNYIYLYTLYFWVDFSSSTALWHPPPKNVHSELNWITFSLINICMYVYKHPFKMKKKFLFLLTFLMNFAMAGKRPAVAANISSSSAPLT